MPRRRRGGLSEDDLAVWAQVAATTSPLAQPARPPAPRSDGGGGGVLHPPEAAPAPSAPLAMMPFRLGQAARGRKPATATLAPTPAALLSDQPLRMDTKAHRKLRQGKTAPEARIDLHGMTLAVAEPVLQDFVLRQHGHGRRLILVITGKGRRDLPDAPLPVRPGALRHYVPQWLQRPPLGALVQQVVPAHFRHGGEGAYYVYLRR